MTRSWIFDQDVSCPLFTFFFFSNIGVSTFSMALIAINRAVRIGLPTRSHILSIKRSWIMVAISWGISFGMMLLPLTEIWGKLGYEPRTFSCTILKKNGSSPMTFLMSVGFLFPFVIIAICYIFIFRKVRMTGKKVNKTAAKTRSSLLFQRKIRTSEIQLTKTVLMISLSYVGCFLPGFLLMVVDPMPPCDDYPDLHVAGYVIYWFSGIVNPIIYLSTNHKFRRACTELLHGKCATSPTGEEVISLTLNRTRFETKQPNIVGSTSV
jgi:hypothetical protein